MSVHAFGIEIDAPFDTPGLPAGGAGVELPRTRVRIVEEAEIEAAWQPENSERLLEERFEPGPPARTIDRDDAAGYRLFARHFGSALISADGENVLCAPPGANTWSWQRFLVGRVLPWASLLRGREVLHAGAVRIGDRAIALVADSGVGKTSLTVQLVLRGGGFVTDDVLAIEPRPEAVTVHPGAGIVAIRPSEWEAVPEREWDRVGRVLGTDGKTYVEVPRESGPLPLGAVYFLSRHDGPTGFQPGADARQLLGSTFIVSVSSPRRLAGLLELGARLSASVPLFQLRIGSDEDAREVAGRIWEHAAENALRGEGAE